MIKKIVLLVSLSLPILFTSCGSSSKDSKSRKELSGRISISGAFALYPITIEWANEFKKLHPDVQIDISAGGAGKGIADALAGMVDLAMLSRDINPVEVQKGAWAITVTKDAVVPVINAANPEISTIHKKGFTVEQFKKVFLQADKTTWGTLFGSSNTSKVNVFTRSDACGAASVWALYLGKEQEDLKGTGVFGDPGIADAVKADKNGIGYNNVIFVYDTKTRKKYQGLEVAAIDINNNGTLDADERFYDSLDSLMHAIKTGKYPSPPARDLYFVSKGKPTSPIVTAFLQFILTKGQSIVDKAGYIQMNDSLAKKELKKLD